MNLDACPSKKKIEKKFLFFKYSVGQKHDWDTTIQWHGLWLEIDRVCNTCGITDRDWGWDDEQIMRWFGLTKCPAHNGQYYSMGNSYSEEELIKKYRIEPE
jgi:hypothetical protein